MAIRPVSNRASKQYLMLEAGRQATQLEKLGFMLHLLFTILSCCAKHQTEENQSHSSLS